MRSLAYGLRRFSLLLLLLVALSAFAGEPPTTVCDPACQTCVGPNSDDCTSCPDEHYLTSNPGSCDECAPIEHCDHVTCTSATTSQCTHCSFGSYENDGTSDTCVPCTPIENCAPSAVSCSTASDSQCVFCLPGHYEADGSPDTCPACTPVTGCNGFVECTNASDSACNHCGSGYYLTGTTCTTCTPVDHCNGFVECETATDTQCSSCEDGYYLVDAEQFGDADVCAACTPVENCDSDVTCNDATDSQCEECGDGTYLADGTADTCPDCTPVTHCTLPTCTSAADSTCATCEDGYYSNAGTCQACTPVTDCTSPITCEAASDSQCTSCAAGHHLVEGPADTCPADGPATNDVPIAGDRARISDLPQKRQTRIVSYDQAIDVMTADPSVTGATLALFSTTSGSSYELDLPAAQWKSSGSGRFRFTAKGDPKIKVIVRNGRLVRIALRGTSGYPLGTPQGSVAVTLTIGTTRFCMLFGGTISTDDGTRFVARGAPPPATCPVPPAP